MVLHWAETIADLNMLDDGCGGTQASNLIMGGAVPFTGDASSILSNGTGLK